MKKILALVLSLIMVLSLSGCKSDSPEAAVEDFFKDAKKFRVDEFKENYGEIYNDLIEARERQGFTEEEMAEIYQDIFKNVKYEIIDVQTYNDKEAEDTGAEKEDASEETKEDAKIEDGAEIADSAIITVKVSNKNMSKAMSEYVDAYYSLLFSDEELTEKELDQKAAEAFKKALKSAVESDEEKTWEYDIVAYKIEDKWVIEGSEEIYHSLTGGLFEDAEEEATDTNQNEDDEVVAY